MQCNIDGKADNSRDHALTSHFCLSDRRHRLSLWQARIYGLVDGDAAGLAEATTYSLVAQFSLAAARCPKPNSPWSLLYLNAVVYDACSCLHLNAVEPSKLQAETLDMAD
jgi:hypothetical protein